MNDIDKKIISYNKVSYLTGPSSKDNNDFRFSGKVSISIYNQTSVLSTQLLLNFLD